MTSTGQTEAYIVNIASETYDYDEYRIHTHDNNIPNEWAQKDG